MDLTASEKEINAFMKKDRFKYVQRPYTAKQLAPLQQSIKITYPSNLMAQKLWKLLSEANAQGKAHLTWGALDAV